MKGSQKINKKLRTQWLGIELQNPIILGSLTLLSHTDIDGHVEFYKKAQDYGVGAVILESFVPLEYGDAFEKKVIGTVRALNNGFSLRNENLGFSLIGPPYPNISSIRYGKELFKRLKTALNIPIVCSIINIGDIDSFIKTAKYFEFSGADGLELNFSCPNVSLGLIACEYGGFPLTNENLSRIKSGINIPFSIKTDPYFETVEKKIIGNIENLTYANAHRGLHPPSIDPPFNSPFNFTNEWCTTGIYGAFASSMAFKEIVSLKKQHPKLSVSLSGGIVEPQNIVESLLLGVDSVQVASVIMWKGLRIIKDMISFLDSFMERNSFDLVDEFKGYSLKNIKDNIASIDYYNKNLSESFSNRPKMRITSKCRQCGQCLDRGCLAIKTTDTNSIYIDSKLCSYCEMCKIFCNVDGAIEPFFI